MLLWFGHGCSSHRMLLTRTLLWFGHGCSSHRMLLEHERYALVTACSCSTDILEPSKTLKTSAVIDDDGSQNLAPRIGKKFTSLAYLCACKVILLQTRKGRPLNPCKHMNPQMQPLFGLTNQPVGFVGRKCGAGTWKSLAQCWVAVKELKQSYHNGYI